MERYICGRVRDPRQVLSECSSLDFSSMGKILDFGFLSLGVPTSMSSNLADATHEERITALFRHEWGPSKLPMSELLQLATVVEKFLTDLTDVSRDAPRA